MFAIARSLHKYWLDGIREGAIKKTVKGFVRAATVASFNAENAFVIKAGDVNAKTQCYKCGGLGHATVTIGPDGSVVECSTKVLGTDVDKKMLSQIVYPDITNKIHGGKPGAKPPKKVMIAEDDASKNDAEQSQSQNECSECSDYSNSSEDVEAEMDLAFKAMAMQTGVSRKELAKYASKKYQKKPHKKRP